MILWIASLLYLYVLSGIEHRMSFLHSKCFDLLSSQASAVLSFIGIFLLVSFFYSLSKLFLISNLVIQSLFFFLKNSWLMVPEVCSLLPCHLSGEAYPPLDLVKCYFSLWAPTHTVPSISNTPTTEPDKLASCQSLASLLWAILKPFLLQGSWAHSLCPSVRHSNLSFPWGRVAKTVKNAGRLTGAGHRIID